MYSEIPELSDGTLSTLGNWRKIAAVLMGEDSPAVKYFDKKIAEQGENQPVIQAESQVLYLIANME